MSAFDRNFGSIATAREFWGGNNGFLTVGIHMPADTHLPTGAAYTAAAAKVKAGTATAAEILMVSNAERNLFRVAQAIGQRAVVVAVSAMATVEATETLASVFVDDKLTNPTYNGNYLAVTRAGTTSTAPLAATPNYYITFMIERADVFTRQDSKPGATYNATIDPAAELATNIQSAGFFVSDDFQATPMGDLSAGTLKQATGVGVLVVDAMIVIK